MGENYLVDTNIIIDFSENKLPHHAKALVAGIIDNNPYFSVINKIELLGFSAVNDIIVELVETATILSLSDEVIHKTITIRRANRIKLPDAIIAATAIVHRLTIITRNSADFKNIEGLTILNPWA